MWERRDNPGSLETRQLSQQLAWLIILRLIFLGVLSMTTLISQLRGEGALLGPSGWVLWVLIFASLLASFIFSLLRHTVSPQRYTWLAAIQLLWDISFTTGIVYATGSVSSIFTPLYCVNIAMGGIVLGKRFGYLLGSICTVFYSSLLALEYHGLLPALLSSTPYVYNLDPIKIFTTIFWNMGLFNVVAYLMGYFGEKLRLAQKQVVQGELMLEKLEDLNAAILENVTSGVITTDAEGKVIRFNKAAVKMLQNVATLSFGLPVEEVLASAKSRITQANQLGHFERRDLTQWEEAVQGRIFNVSISSLHGRGVVLALQDMTEFREMEEHVKRNDRLAAVGKLAAAMAHEIRNPLASISGSIEILQGESRLESNRRLMDIVLRETDRLNNLIGDFLDFARPTPPLFSEVDLYALVEETVMLFGNQQATLKIEILGNRGLWVFGDSAQLRQVLWNLLKNAQEATVDQGKVQIRLGSDVSKGEIFIEVADEGKGIPEDLKEKIFDPFFTTKPRGSGLGLATVAKIVTAHKGQISVTTSTPAKRGATLRLQFPEVGAYA